MAANESVPPAQPRTLMQAHEALVRIRPQKGATLGVWKTYYERSAALYREIAEIDRGHHHEALYWADREQEQADQITARIRAKKSPADPTPVTEGGNDHGNGA